LSALTRRQDWTPLGADIFKPIARLGAPATRGDTMGAQSLVGSWAPLPRHFGHLWGDLSPAGAEIDWPLGGRPTGRSCAALGEPIAPRRSFCICAPAGPNEIEAGRKLATSEAGEQRSQIQLVLRRGARAQLARRASSTNRFGGRRQRRGEAGASASASATLTRRSQ